MLFVILIAVFLAGCVGMQTTKTDVCMCPSQDIIIQGTPDEQGFLQIPKGALDDPDSFWTLPEFEADMRELREYQQKAGESIQGVEQ